MNELLENIVNAHWRNEWGDGIVARGLQRFQTHWQAHLSCEDRGRVTNGGQGLLCLW